MNIRKHNIGSKIITMKTQQNTSKYQKAVKHVTELKAFYEHVFVFIFFVIVWFLFKENIITFVVTNTDTIDSGFLHWLRVNIALVPILWGIGVLLHGLYVYKFKFSFFKKWEDTKIKELMEKDQFK